MAGADTKTAGKRRLSGAQKCAVLCMIVGLEEAAKILHHLTPQEIEAVTKQIASMPTVDQETVEQVLDEYRQSSIAPKLTARGGIQFAQKLVEKTLGESASQPVVELLRGQSGETGLTRLSQATPEILAGILRGEHPQTIALILAHLNDLQASKLLQQLEPNIASEVLYRVARMDRIPPEVLALVEAGLNKKADVSLSQEMRSSGGPAAVAKLLNLAQGGLEEKLLGAIQERNEDLADQIKALMFVFEDLLQIDSRGIQRVLREVEGKDLALALKAASEELKEHIKSNMSERAAEALEEEIELLGPVRVSDVDAAHGRIIEVVRQLDSAGEIMIRRKGGGDDIIP